ncbi:paired immunoglobulin-like type 2 receptor alpha isoform X2 [Rousettus aegyptiacus]|nr:paired immunoglobulin-like type 2 receptor alpha isoform X2 [Rousettus aegyptiacus]KAF6441855.1 hypothetical protein HJG63_015331 [Rousettus aegyptiacus]
MGLLLLLPLLLPAALQADSSAKCNSKHWHEVNQPEYLSASEGDSIHIPFSFCYPWELDENPNVNIIWRWKHFHGEFIYNMNTHFIHKDFENRLSLSWTRSSRNGSLQISKLRREDECWYFCRVQLTTQRHGRKASQSISGTKLAITRATEKTTQVPTSTAASTTDGLSGSRGKRSPGSWPQCTEAVVSMALTITVLKISILGWIVYLRWKKSKGLRTKARAPARGSFQNTEKCENTGNKG